MPDYLLQEPLYDGGLAPQVDNPGEGKAPAMGWVAKQWHRPVRQRFQRLIAALAKKFDGRIVGLNLPETAADVDPRLFSAENYFRAELDNLAFARKAFQKSHVVQYVNFWPGEWNNDRRFMERTFAFAAKHQIGLGGPDIVPYRPAQMQNAYPWFNRYRKKLPLVAMAVQEPTLTYTNPATRRPFTREEIVNFARGYLGANIIFWTPRAAWLKK